MLILGLSTTHGQVLVTVVSLAADSTACGSDGLAEPYVYIIDWLARPSLALYTVNYLYLMIGHFHSHMAPFCCLSLSSRPSNSGSNMGMAVRSLSLF